MRRFYTSKQTEERFDKIIETMAQSGTKIKIVSLAKICFALSLREYGKELTFEPQGNDGKEILDSHFLGQEERFYKAILDTVYNKKLTDAEFFSRICAIKFHVDKGAEILFSMFEDAKWDAETFKDKLIDLVA